MRPNFKRVFLPLLFVCAFLRLSASLTYPEEPGQRVKYEFMIEMPKAYVSGILVMALTEPDLISASLVNEFGFSLIDFTFDEKRQKVKLVSVTKKLDKWYIRRTLRSDLKQVLAMMKQGSDAYTDKKHKINYTFRLLNDSAE